MAYQLVADVLDHAPATLTAAEVLVLIAIAEATRTLGEPREIPTDDLTRRTRLDRRGLRDAIARLAKRGITVRVVIGVDRRSKPLYAVPGRVPRWLLPAFPAPPGCGCRGCEQGGATAPPVEGDTAPPPTNPQVTEEATQLLLQTEEEPQHRQTEPQHRQEEPQHRQPDATAPPNPSHAVPVINQRPPTVAYLVTRTGATDDETNLLIQTIKDRFRPRTLGAYLRAMSDDDLADLLAEIRTTPTANHLPPKCGRCAPNRLIDLPDGRASRCPDCHPRSVIARTA